MKKYFLLLSVLVFLAISVSDAVACSCVFSKPSDSVETTDTVFIGKITKVLKAKRKWQVQVSSVVKGDVPKTVTFYASIVGTSCENSNFKLSQTYVFFANEMKASEVGHYKNSKVAEDEKEKIGNYEPETCSWTTKLINWKSAEFKRQLQEYKDEDFFNIINTGKKSKSNKQRKSE